jgi:branched-chain amino acid transport system substrate-binding protein
MVRRRMAVGVVAVLVLVASACGNESNKSATSTSSGAGTGSAKGPFANLAHIAAPNPCTNDPGVTASTIKLGVVVPQSGPQAVSFAIALDGIKARIDKANSSGELGARKITLVTRDDAADQTRNQEAVRGLVENDKVFGVIEVTSTSGGGAAYLNQKGVPVTGWHVGIPAWGQDPNMFTFRLPASADPLHNYTDRAAQLMKTLGGTKVALVGGANSSSADFLTRNKHAITTIGGMQVVVDNETVTADQRDFTAEAQRIKDAHADALLTGMDFLQNTALSDQLAKVGVKPKVVVFPGGYDSRVLALPGIEGAVFGLEFFPFEMNKPAYQAFNAAMPAGAVRNQISFIGWLSAEITLQGLKDAGVSCPTRKAFIANLRLEHAYTGGGAFDPVDLEAGFGKEFPCTYYVRVEHAKFVPLFGGKTQCGKPITF